MKLKKINSIFILGGLAFLGILALQFYWIVSAWHVRSEDFMQKANYSLRRVAKLMADKSGHELPKTDLIFQLSRNEIIVNYNNEISVNILEDYLIRELDLIEPGITFEYAVYDCHTDDLVYGDCCQVEDDIIRKIEKKLPKLEEFTYYFIVRFPDKGLYIFSNLSLFFLLGIFTVIIGFAYLFAIKVLYRQKKLSELQKDFVDNMTHEFKTPLTSIKLATNVLLESEAVSADKRLRKYSDIIFHQSEKLNSHIERMLDLIRTDRNFKLKMEQVDIIELISELNEEIVREENGSGAEIVFEKPEHPLSINADRYHLTNALHNIYDNALKYNVSDKKIIRVTLKEDGSAIDLSIQDNGIGIKAEYQSRIFDKFYRVQKGDIHNYKGFGLGLYYVKNIVELHGWSISVESKENEYTNFKIKIRGNENGR